MYPLEHFYYGQLVHHGKPVSEMRVLARSKGIDDGHIADILQSGLIPSLDAPYGAWGILRGKASPFYLIQSQIGSAKQTLLHIYPLVSELLRVMAGNLRGFIALLNEHPPIFETLGDSPPPVVFAPPEPLSISEQTDDLLELMTYAHNRTQTIEFLLAAVVEGTGLVIQKAPTDMHTRSRFVQGLLTLLPSSTRFGVTFTTNNDHIARLNAQVMFMEDTPPSGAVVFDWQSGQISGREMKDDYSRFIVSQLRLDAELALKRAEELTPIAGWRVKLGDRLAEALAYASSRIRLDNALASNQPVEIEELSKVLAEDPTLDDDKRALYAEHVVKFALAMDKMQYADPVAPLLRTQPQLEARVRQQFATAITEGDAQLVYETLARWLTDPLGPQGPDWLNLMHQSLLKYLDGLVEEQALEEIGAMLDHLAQFGEALGVARLTPSLIHKLVPILNYEPALAKRLLNLGFTHLDNNQLKHLLETKALAKHIPPALNRILSAMSSNDTLPNGALIAATKELGDVGQGQAMLRLTELAHEVGRIDLIDADALEGLARIATSADGARYAKTLVEVAKSLHETQLKRLKDPAPRYLLQILLAMEQYYLLPGYLIQQSRDIYPGDRQGEYIRHLQKLFGGVKMTPQQAQVARTALVNGGIKGIPLLVASVGILEAADWSSDLANIADEVTNTLYSNLNYLELIHPSVALGLLRFYGRIQDAPNALRVAQLIPTIAAYQETTGLNVMARMYQLMAWDDELKATSLEQLRQYIRAADDKSARRAIQSFGKSLGAEVERQLEVAYIFSRFMGRLPLAEYANALKRTADLLRDMIDAYEGKSHPEMGDLREHSDKIRHHYDEAQRHALADAVSNLGRALLSLGRSGRQLNSRKIDALLGGTATATNPMEAFWAMAHVFSRGKRLPASIPNGERVNPFPGRTAKELYDDLMLASAFIRNAVRVFSPDRPLQLTAAEVREEMSSLWRTVPEDDRNDVAIVLGADLQRLLDYIVHITQGADNRIFNPDNGTGQKLVQGKQRPRSVIELLRYYGGAFR